MVRHTLWKSHSNFGISSFRFIPLNCYEDKLSVKLLMHIEAINEEIEVNYWKRFLEIYYSCQSSTSFTFTLKKISTNLEIQKSEKVKGQIWGNYSTSIILENQKIIVFPEIFRKLIFFSTFTGLNLVLLLPNQYEKLFGRSLFQKWCCLKEVVSEMHHLTK